MFKNKSPFSHQSHTMTNQQPRSPLAGGESPAGKFMFSQMLNNNAAMINKNKYNNNGNQMNPLNGNNNYVNANGFNGMFKKISQGNTNTNINIDEDLGCD